MRIASFVTCWFYFLTCSNSLSTAPTTAPRLEIRKFKQNPEQWSLFILALQQIQNLPPTNKTSYYTLAALNGQEISYNGQNASVKGFRPRGTVYSPPWNRVYVSLMEETLVNTAKEIASRYTSSKRSSMQQAASSLRLPYWDFAYRELGSSSFVAEFMQQTVYVDTPTGGPQWTRNPLYQYRYYPGWTPQGTDPRYPDYTVRSPNPKTFQSQDNISATVCSTGYYWDAIRDTFRDIVNSQISYDNFETKGFEQLSGAAHVCMGGFTTSLSATGTATSTQLANFGPVVWLLDCNMDRVFTLWQLIYSDSYVTTDGYLLPFYDYGRGRWWQAPAARYVSNFRSRGFGYTYDDPVMNASASEVKAYLNSRYNPRYDSSGGG